MGHKGKRGVERISIAKRQKNYKLFRKLVILAFIVLAIYGIECISGIVLVTKPLPSTANLPDSSITMQPESKPDAPKIEQIIERQAKAWETADAEKIIADFAEDSLFIAPGVRFRGKQEIKQAAESYFAEFTDTRVTIKRIIVNGNEGAVEWTWHEKKKETSEESQAEDAIIFELEAGKIKYWREYIDKEIQR